MKLRFNLMTTFVHSSNVSEVIMLVKLNGGPCGLLLCNDLKANQLSTEKAYSKPLDMTVGAHQCICIPRSSFYLRFTSNATGISHKKTHEGENFAINTRDIAMFVAVSIFIIIFDAPELELKLWASTWRHLR